MLIQILMSTYNGEEYLTEQLDSLLSQTIMEKEGWEMKILIRDDGSKDRTCDILQDYAKKDSRIRYVACANEGVIHSFFELIDLSEKDADYLAFCDQDDVWMPEKLERAVTKLTERAKAVSSPAVGSPTVDSLAADKPLLYCSRPLLTDSSLNPIDTVWLGGKFYLVAPCFGEVYYDTKAQIYYRQHGGNAVGMKKNHIQEFVQRMQSYRKKRGSNMRQAQAFLDFCKEYDLAIPKSQKKLVKDMANMKKYPKARWRLLKNKAVYRQRRGDDLVFKLLILLGEG